jgi:hypothetical protein
MLVPYDTISLDGKPKRTSMKKEMNFATLVYFIMTLTLPLFKDIAAAAILAINDVALNALKSSKKLSWSKSAPNLSLTLESPNKCGL